MKPTHSYLGKRKWQDLEEEDTSDVEQDDMEEVSIESEEEDDDLLDSQEELDELAELLAPKVLTLLKSSIETWFSTGKFPSLKQITSQTLTSLPESFKEMTSIKETETKSLLEK